MNTFLRLIIVIGIFISLCSPCYAGWKEKIVKNQKKAITYISALKSGADPNKLKRPVLRRDKKAKANIANRKIRKAMVGAEALARSGKHDLIEIPDFKNKLDSKEKKKKSKITTGRKY